MKLRAKSKCDFKNLNYNTICCVIHDILENLEICSAFYDADIFAGDKLGQEYYRGQENECMEIIRSIKQLYRDSLKDSKE